MTLYEEMYYNMPNLSKFYRFEGFKSFSHYFFQEDEYLNSILNYIYFSGTEGHHMYYVKRRLRQLIYEEILSGTNLNMNKKTLLDTGSFNEIIKCVENYSPTNKLLSIESSISSLMIQLLYNNSVSNRRKMENDRRIERVDYNIYGGGYGFCEEWLRVFDLLTFFTSYRRITTENILDFLHIYRRNLIESKSFQSPVSFLLDPKNLVVRVNTKVYCDFSKYELMDALQKIVESQLYFPGSIFSFEPNEQIRKIVQEYILEREQFLDLQDSIYQRSLLKK